MIAIDAFNLWICWLGWDCFATLCKLGINLDLSADFFVEAFRIRYGLIWQKHQNAKHRQQSFETVSSMMGSGTSQFYWAENENWHIGVLVESTEKYCCMIHFVRRIKMIKADATSVLLSNFVLMIWEVQKYRAVVMGCTKIVHSLCVMHNNGAVFFYFYFYI